MKRHFSLGRAEIWLLAIFRCFFDAFSPHFKKSPKLFSNNKISNQGSKHIVKGWNLNVQRKHLDQIQKFAKYSHFNLGDFCDSTFINKKYFKSQTVALKTTLKCDFGEGLWSDRLWFQELFINKSGITKITQVKVAVSCKFLDLIQMFPLYIEVPPFDYVYPSLVGNFIFGK